MRTRRITMIAVGLGASAVFIWLAMRGLDLSAVKRAFAEAELVPWLPLGIGLYFASHLVRGVRCKLLVKKHATLGLATATNVVVVAYGANNVLPARLGEFVRAGMLAERANMPLSQSLGVTFIERVLDGLTMLLLLVIATFTADVAHWMRELVYVALAVFGMATIVMVVGAIWPQRIIRLAVWASRPLGVNWQARFEVLATNVTNAGACLRDPKDALLLVVYSVVVWCLEAGLYVAVLPIFGIPMTVQFAVITMCVTGFGLLLPSSPGAIGPYHYFASQAMMVHGVAAPTALAYATLVHLSWYIPITIWGAIVMLWYGVKLSSASELAETAKAAKTANGANGATATATGDGAPAAAVATVPADTVAPASAPPAA